ncbi:MAG: (d)CMP kinase [Clostridia bacterium]|nr:(d)CMP kinase [Clostridia bacterium]
MKTYSVAIDGPAGAGKSTIAKAAAAQLRFIYIDTGAMYRAVALYAIRNDLPWDNAEGKLAAALDNIEIAIDYVEDSQHIFLNGEDVSGLIRTPQVSAGASAVATVQAVRIKLVELQRKLAKGKNVIMDGRDIGTHVLPDADVKIYLTASVDARAQRRYKELMEKGEKVDFETIKTDIIARDKNDSEREFSPLRQAEDALFVDNSNMNVEESVNYLISVIKEGIE